MTALVLAADADAGMGVVHGHYQVKVNKSVQLNIDEIIKKMSDARKCQITYLDDCEFPMD